MELVTLNTKEQLDIFMSPQRQRLLRILDQSAEPKTPKELSAELGVSPSSVQHHLKKLESLGLVCVDHTANIRGIVARYYAATRVTVRIGAAHSCTFASERTALLKMLVANVLDDAVQDSMTPASAGRTGDVLTGTVHLPAGRKAELEQLIRQFLEQNATPSAHTEPWEYALVYHCPENPK